MQTFLPYADFERSAKALDTRRLGKQRVEAYQILRGLHRPNYGWRNHPAVLMWRGYDEALAAYGIAMCREWVARGYNDTVHDKLVEELGYRPRSQRELQDGAALPPWLGAAALHLSHRSALVRKAPEYYAEEFPDVPPDLPYEWPTKWEAGAPPTASSA